MEMSRLLNVVGFSLRRNNADDSYKVEEEGGEG